MSWFTTHSQNEWTYHCASPLIYTANRGYCFLSLVFTYEIHKQKIAKIHDKKKLFFRRRLPRLVYKSTTSLYKFCFSSIFAQENKTTKVHFCLDIITLALDNFNLSLSVRRLLRSLVCCLCLSGCRFIYWLYINLCVYIFI